MARDRVAPPVAMRLVKLGFVKPRASQRPNESQERFKILVLNIGSSKNVKNFDAKQRNSSMPPFNKPITTTTDGYSVQKLSQEDVNNSIAAIPVSVDNQWVPRSILRDIVDHGYLPNAWSEKRDNLARAEFLRSLIDNERLIINRAYIFNSSVIQNEYIYYDHCDNYFADLIADGTIIVALAHEESPAQIPNFPIQNEDLVRKKWPELCKTIPSIPLLRMSWDENENKDIFQHVIYKNFVSRLLSLGSLSVEKACRDLNLGDNEVDSLNRALFELVQWINKKKNDEKKSINRNDIYKTFFIKSNKSVADRFFIGDKMRLSLKELSDLVYNINMSEAYGVISSSPDETLNRTALQELNPKDDKNIEINAEEIVRFCRQFALDAIKKTYAIPHISELEVKDIVELRNSEPHRRYIDYLRNFLKAAQLDLGGVLVPSGTDGVDASGLLSSYEEVIGELSAKTRKKRVDKWTKNLTLRFETPGSTLEVDVHSNKIKLARMNLAEITNRAVPFVVKCVIGGADFSTQNLGSTFEIHKGKMTNPKDQWHELYSRMKEQLTKFDVIEENDHQNRAASMRSEDMCMFDFVG